MRLLEMLLPQHRARVVAGRPPGPWLVLVDGVAPVEVRFRGLVVPEFERLRRLYPGVRIRAVAVGEVRP